MNYLYRNAIKVACMEEFSGALGFFQIPRRTSIWDYLESDLNTTLKSVQVDLVRPPGSKGFRNTGNRWSSIQMVSPLSFSSIADRI